MAIISLIKLGESHYYSLIRAAIESWPREVMGEIYGKRHSDTLRITNVYEFVTAKRLPTSVSYGNDEAIKRLRRLDEVIRRNKYLKSKLVGGFHTHVIGRSNRDLLRKEQNSLSKDDLNFIKDEMNIAGLNEWIEILVRIERKTYSTIKRPSKTLTYSSKKMKIKIRDFPHQGYDITFSAFHIDKNLKVKEIKIRNGEMLKSA
ncbi:hypothetical protein COU60_04035 [Candidatus Pacearchaeota archaeon CG10_big_fil_rev_8_21_14_0_10_34_76]|nr:MAG: hypothetical protein COU60_04035 [Candidatus Pacearchaeota archaeon CG10_big_fil_rev_8_21_14_0_10_34_76]